MSEIEKLRDEFWKLKIKVLGPKQSNDFVLFSIAGFGNDEEQETYLSHRRKEFVEAIKQEFIQKGNKSDRLLFQLEVQEHLSDLVALYSEYQGDFLNTLVTRNNLEYEFADPRFKDQPYYGLSSIFKQQRDFFVSLTGYIKGLGPWIDSLKEASNSKLKGKKRPHWIRYKPKKRGALTTLRKLLVEEGYIESSTRLDDFRKIFTDEEPVAITWLGGATELVYLFKTLFIEEYKIFEARNPLVHLKEHFVLPDGSELSGNAKTYKPPGVVAKTKLQKIVDKVVYQFKQNSKEI